MGNTMTRISLFQEYIEVVSGYSSIKYQVIGGIDEDN
jgi:hypothetical protein